MTTAPPASEGDGGRRQAPDGEGRPKGRALAGRPPRSPNRSLRCAECGELRPPSALLTMDQVALRLGTSLRHMRRLVAERRIPIVKVGRFVRFDGHDVEHWVDDHRVGVVVPASVAIRAARKQRTSSREHRRAMRAVEVRSIARGGGVAVPAMRPFGSVRQRGRLYEASYWHNGRRHVAPTSFTTKGDARAFLSAVETDIRRGVWIDPWAGRLRVWELAEEWTAVQSDQAESTTAREELTLRLHVLPTHRRARIERVGPPGHPAARQRMAGPSTLPGRSSATTRSCGPCSATPCATTGWPGTRAATSTCRRSRAPAAST